MLMKYLPLFGLHFLSVQHASTLELISYEHYWNGSKEDSFSDIFY